MFKNNSKMKISECLDELENAIDALSIFDDDTEVTVMQLDDGNLFFMVGDEERFLNSLN